MEASGRRSGAIPGKAIAGLAGVAAWLPALVIAGGGPLGIDHKLELDESGIWSRNVQVFVQGAVITSVLAGAVSEGADARLGRTLWQSVDAMAIGAVTAQGMKVVFSRARPSQTDDPGLWFQGSGHRSFPSGEVMTMATAVTPVIIEYAGDHPAVWALAALPVYDSVARMKSHAHWQTDCLASIAIGGALGTWTHSRAVPFSVQVLPHGVTVGWRKSF